MDFVLSEEVRAGIATGKGVVALESTIISHGMPYPQNFETALQVEQVVRDNGAVPATIAILDGRVHIGLDRDSLHTLAKLGGRVNKTSRRDIAAVIASKGFGATTVSATMYLAHLAGIRVFVTGGIGGVHRGGEVTMDISADLTELGRTPVAVICAGAKSILDIGRTLEFLETQGVPVIGYKTNEFPAFFTPHSGHPTSCTAESPEQGAALIHVHTQLGLGGLVVAVPIPQEHAAEGAVIEAATSQALEEADKQHVTGNQITPFLLKRINELTSGKSLASNIKLVRNNAAVGGQIAAELAKLSITAKL